MKGVTVTIQLLFSPRKKCSSCIATLKFNQSLLFTDQNISASLGESCFIYTQKSMKIIYDIILGTFQIKTLLS